MDLKSNCEAAGDESLGQLPLFLAKLFDILSADSWRPVIRWSEDGRSFVVADVTNFERQVLPLYWGHSSLPSFIQSLRMYHFEGKSLYPADGLEFSHASFARVRRRLHSCPDLHSARDLLALLHARCTALTCQHTLSQGQATTTCTALCWQGQRELLPQLHRGLLKRKHPEPSVAQIIPEITGGEPSHEVLTEPPDHGARVPATHVSAHPALSYPHLCPPLRTPVSARMELSAPLLNQSYPRRTGH